MKKPNTYRMSLEKHNAPYRGVSSRSDYVNFQLAVSHDLLHALTVSGADKDIRGHRHQNEDMMRSILSGDRNIETADYSAGTIKSVVEEFKELSDLTGWSVPHLTYGRVERVGDRAFRLVPPSTDKGFFELEHVLHVSPGDKLMIRFNPREWNPNTVYQFGAKQVDAGGDDFKSLQVDEWNTYTEVSNRYFEHTLRFTEERDVRLFIQTENNPDGTLGSTPLILDEFGVYLIEEIPVHTRSLATDIIPSVNDQKLQLKHLEQKHLEERRR